MDAEIPLARIRGGIRRLPALPARATADDGIADRELEPRRGCGGIARPGPAARGARFAGELRLAAHEPAAHVSEGRVTRVPDFQPDPSMGDSCNPPLRAVQQPPMNIIFAGTIGHSGLGGQAWANLQY